MAGTHVWHQKQVTALKYNQLSSSIVTPDTEIIERFQNKALKMMDILVVCNTQRITNRFASLKAAAIRDEGYSFRLKYTILLGGKLNELVKETLSRRFNLHLIDVLDLNNVNYTESLWIKIVQP